MLTWLTWFRWVTLMIALSVVSYYGYRTIPWSCMDATVSAYWVAAIGTMGTLIGTVWLASSEARKRRKEKMALAVIQAAHCQYKIQASLKSFEHIVKLLGPSDKTLIPINNRMSAIETIDSIPLIDNQELIALVPLEGNCAIKIASVQNALGNLRSHIASIPIIQPQRLGVQQMVGIDLDGAYFAAAIAQTQVERLWGVMKTFREVTGTDR